MKELLTDKIYTKTGDKGTTSDYLGKIYSKSDIEIELVGSIDEVNANIGHLRSKLHRGKYSVEVATYVDNLLKEIQYHLYLIGVEFATDFTEIHITEDEVEYLEKSIDYMVDQIEPMTSFIYYSGSESATFTHVIRTITRRTERVFVRALKAKAYPQSYLYINRLSDLLFSLARYLNLAENIKDEHMNLK
jgi:cob(I)alamin adenosyltransferase